MTRHDKTLPAALDLALALAWVTIAIGGYLNHAETVEFVCDLAQAEDAATLSKTALRLGALDPGDTSDELIFVLGEEKFISIRGRQAARYWDDAWSAIRDSARRSEIEVIGRPQGRPGASLELIPATEFSRLERAQGDDGGSRIIDRSPRDRFWDRVEILTADVLRLWPVDAQNSDLAKSNEDRLAREAASRPERVTRTRGPKPVLRLAVEQAMREAVKDGFDLEREKEELLEQRFNASRDTCRKARDRVLAETYSDNLHRATNSDKR